MIIITKEQAKQRFTVLPESLQDAIFSDQNGEIISDVAESNHLGDERTDQLSLILGWVLLGFIHLEDLPRELQEQLSIPPQTAGAVASSLTAKIFNPLRADLEKAYAPLPQTTFSTSGPKILEEIRPVVPVAPKVPTPAYQVKSVIPAPAPVVTQNVAPKPVVVVAPLPTPMMASTPSVPQQSVSSGTGWSKMPIGSSATGPKTVDLRNSNPLPARPTTFQNLQKTETSKIPLPPMGDSAVRGGQLADQGPMPVILENMAAMPIPQQPYFALKSEDKIAALGTNAPRPDARPAVLEFGGQTPPMPPRLTTPPSSVPRMVNYSDTPPQADRNITELTKDEMPKPPVPLA